MEKIRVRLACLFLLAFGPIELLAVLPSERPMLPNFDERISVPSPATAEQQSEASKAQATLAQTRIEFDDLTGSPKWIYATDGFLSGPGGAGRLISAGQARAFAGTAYAPTKAFLSEHRGLFGFGPEALDGARLKREFETPHNGMQTVVWEQQLDNIPLFEGLLITHTTKNGELVNVSSHFITDPAKAASAGTPNRATLETAPLITAEQALAGAVRNIGEELSVAQVNSIVEPAKEDAERHHKFRAPGLKGEAEAHLVWLPMNNNSMRLCWDVVFMSRTRGEMFRMLIDAETGRTLLRHCLTSYISDATYRVYISDSPSPFSPGWPTPQSGQPPIIPRVLITTNAYNTNASPNGWINDGGNETLGNNVDAHTDRNADNLPDLPRPQGSPTRVFDFPLDLSLDPTNYANAAVVQLFFLCNWYHDRLYELGFTEAAGNFQVNNFGRGGLGNDPVLADAQDGSGVNNANFSTPSDGSSGRMQMYLFSGPVPRRDGDLDAEIVFHEHTHGLSNRRVGGGVGISALQTGGMGEGWSDFYGLTLLSEAGDDVNGNYAAGGYATYLFSGLPQNYYFGIRRYPYSTDMTKNPLTFKDIDPAQISAHTGVPKSTVVGGGGASEVHNQGEVWCVTLWEMRANLVNKYGFTNGNQLTLQLVTDAMNLSPANPTFLQARNAILQADQVDNSGLDLGDIWMAFAKRGMGASATSPASSTTSGVVEAFDVPDTLSLSPGTGFTARGPQGGPFAPSSQVFTLVNTGPNTLNWAARNTNTWLTLSLAGGALNAGQNTNVTLSLNGVAATLPLGVYNGTVWFTNLATGITQNRTVTLRSGQVDYFTQIFTNADNDLDNETITFTPDGSTNFYAVCREPGSVFPTDPNAGTNITVINHSYLQLTLPTGTNVSIYGIAANVVFVGSGGFLNLLSGDSSALESLATHFSLPRISGLMAHLHPQDGGAVTWQQSSNRITVSFLHVWEYGTTATNNFQMELFFDGRIRMTHLGIGTVGGLAGLSAGTGVPSDFQNSDLTSYGPCLVPLSVVVATNATEGDGILTNRGIVGLPAAMTTNVILNLTSSNTNKATVPASVTVPAGDTNVTFDITIVDNTNIDGTQTAIITAAGAGFANGTGVITVFDNESVALTVALPPALAENLGTITGQVQLASIPDANILIDLTSSNTNLFQVPSTVLVPSGQTSTVFSATIVDDNLINGNRSVSVTAHVANWTDGQAGVQVRDDETTNLVLTVPAQAREGDGVLANAGLVQISGLLPTNLVVALSSGNLNKALVPATASIPAGTTSATFDITIVDNNIIDGTAVAVITAAAQGFSNGVASVSVLDNESPWPPANPTPPHQATNVAYATGLGWDSGALPGEVITNDVYFGTNPAPGAGQYVGTTTNTTWSLPSPLAPLTTYYWQVVAKKAGQTPGPVWQFTTLGVDHFNWGSIAATQFVGEPFAALITAKDNLERTVTNFAGPVNLSGSASGFLITNVIIGDLPVFTSGSGDYTLGYSFTPSTNITVTHVRSYAGVKVSIWTDGGALLTSQPIAAPFGGWIETPLSTPVALVSGTRYRVAFYTGGTNYYYASTGINTFPNGTIDQSYEGFGDIFPNSVDSARWWLVDLQYTVGAAGGVPVAPLTTTPFSSGTWAGNITFQAAATNLVLRATDSQGHSGNSSPLAAILRNDVSIGMVDSPNPVSLGANVTYAISVTNIGPAAANAVTITNLLPSGASFVSAVSSQGTCANTGNLVSCNLGVLPGGSVATVTIVATANQAGKLINQVTVFRAETDPYPANNTVVTITPVVIPAVSINDVSLLEGNSGTTNAVFNVSITPASPQVTVVHFATTNGTASTPSDYVGTNGDISFGVGETNKTLSVTVNGDGLYEFNETFVVTLSGVTNANLVKSQGVATILNDDPLPTFSISDVNVQEGNLGTTSAVFVVSLSAPSSLAASVAFTTVAGSATSGSDFVARSGGLTLAPGVTTSNVSITINGDTAVESDESFYVDLSGPVNAILGKREGVGTIVNDDGLPGQADHFVWSTVPSPEYLGEPFAETITALDAYNGPASSFNGTVALTASGSGGVTSNTILGNLTFSTTSSGTLTLGYSFTPNTNITVTHVRSMSGTKVSIWTDSGLLLATQNVSGVSGTWTETPLSQSLPLTGGVRYRVGFYTGGGLYYYTTIGSNVFPNGTINQSYTSIGNTFPSNISSIQWWMVDLRYTAGAGQSLPMTPSVSGPFTNGVWTGNIAVQAVGTNVSLRAEDGNGHNGSSSAFAVLLRNDLSVSLVDSPHPVTLGANITYSIVVTNTGPNPATGVTVTNLLPAGASFVSATSSQGTPVNSGRVVSCALGTLGSSSAATLTIVGTVNQAINLTNQVSVYRAETDPSLTNNTATVVTPVVTLPSLSIGNVNLQEGNSGVTNAAFAVSLSPPSAQTVTVSYATANSTALAGSDYQATNGVLTFAPGQTNQTILVAVNGDVIYEPNETFLVNLSGQLNATIAKSQGLGTIINDDALPTLSIADAGMIERNAGLSSLFFTVTLSAPSSLTTTVNFATAGGTATSGIDFIARSGLLSLPPGVTVTNIAISVYGDTLVEPDETFYLDLSGPSNATLAKREGVGTIVNDDGLPGQVDHFVWGLVASPQYVSEPFMETISAMDAFNNPANSFTGTVSISGFSIPITPAIAGPFVSGSWTGNATVLAPAASAVLYADDGNGHYGTNTPFSVLLRNDISVSVQDSPNPVGLGANVTYTLTITNIGPNAATGVIVTNILAPGAGFISAVSSQGTPVNDAGVIRCPLGTLPGGSAATITILAAANQAGTLSNQAAVYRTETDPYAANNTAITLTPVIAPALSINDVSVIEGNSGATNAVFSVSLFPASAQLTTVSFATADSTATAGSDYSATNGMLVFAPGETNKLLSVVVFGDTNSEPNETFLVLLSNVTNANVVKGQGIATILNDDLAGTVGVFHNPAFVDTGSGGVSSEPTNVVASLKSLNFQTATFTDITTAASTFSTLLFPEFEIGDLSIALTAAERLALSNYVQFGGILIVHGDANGNVMRFLNLVFGFSVLESSQSSSSTLYNRTAQAASTPFAAGPLTVMANNGTSTLATNTLPAGALNIYDLPGQSIVTLAPRGSGAIVFLGWDWYNAVPIGTQDNNWLSVLNIAAGLRLGPQPPMIVSQPASRIVGIGGAAGFSVGVSGSAPLSYQWRKESTNLVAGTGSSYSVSNAQTNDAGNYSVVVTNNYGAVTSAIATLTVVLNPPCGLTSNYVQSVNFTDALSSTAMTLAFDGTNYWSCSGGNTTGARLARYDSSGAFISSYAPGLDFRSVFTDLSGALYARQYASPIIYKQTSPGVFPPSGVQLTGGSLDSQSSVVLNGEGDEFIAMSAGTVYRWALNGTYLGAVSLVGFGNVPGENIGPANRGIAALAGYWLTYKGAGILSAWDPISGTRVATSTLTSAGSSSDSAYSLSYCNGKIFVVDQAGGAWRGYDVCASAPPVIFTQPFSQTLKAGTNAGFTVSAGGSPPLRYQWRKNGQPLTNSATINGATGSVLAISPVTEADSGQYSVTVTNNFGSITSSNATLLVSALDHFAWSAIPATQFVNVPFAVTLQALDATNGLLASFNGTAGLNAITNSSSGVAIYDFESGLQGFITNNTVGNGNGLWHWSTGRAAQGGHSASHSIYYGFAEGPTGGGTYNTTNLSGTTIANEGVITSPEIDLRSTISPPTLSFNHLINSEPGTSWDHATVEVSTNGGASYLVIASNNQGGVPFTNNTGGSFQSLSLSLSNFVGSRILLRFHFNTVDGGANNYEGWYIDDLAISGVGGAGSIGLAPTNTGAFTNGVWTGNLTVSAAATNVSLRADDAAGHVGVSTPFTVLLGADLSAAIASSPNVVFVGDRVTYSVSVTNRGPAAVTGVWLTNDLPNTLSLLSVTPSQGTYTIVGNSCRCAIGALAAGASAQVIVVGAATAPGSVTNLANVLANEADFSLPNNAAAAVTTVLARPVLGFALNGRHLILTWTGPFMLQSSLNVSGPYVDMPGVSSPYDVDTTVGPRRFFRLRAAAGSLAIARPAAHQFVVTWAGPYVLQSSTNSVQGPFLDVPSAASPYTNVISGPQKYFRLRN